MFANIFKSAKNQVVTEANVIYYELWRTNKAVTVVKESYYNDTFRVSCGCPCDLESGPKYWEIPGLREIG